MQAASRAEDSDFQFLIDSSSRKTTQPLNTQNMILQLFLDWDETLTSKDTLSLIAPSSPPTPSSSLPSSPRFSTLSLHYMQDLSKHNEIIQSPTNLRDQMKYLSSIDQVELKSQARVESSGLFKGFEPNLLETRVKDLTFRRGWASTSEPSSQSEPSASGWIQSKSKAGLLDLHVISVGWSAQFIRLGLSSPKGGSFPPDIPKSIVANEIQIGKDGKGTGKMTKSNDATRFEDSQVGNDEADNVSSPQEKFSGIRTGIHKLREFRRLRKERGEKLKDEELATIYVGDSQTDLPCLLAANVGIIIGDSKSLLQTIERLGLNHNLSRGFEDWKQKRTGEEGLGSRGLGSRLEESKTESQDGEEELWEEIIKKEETTKAGGKGGFDLVKVQDWSEGLKVLKVIGGE